MRWIRPFGFPVAAIAALGMMFPVHAARSEPFAPAASEALERMLAVADVELEAGGALRGQIVDGAGQPLPETEVILLRGGAEVGRAQSDAEGWFVVPAQRGGVYQLASDQGVRLVRAWMPGTAPPHAQKAAMLVAGDVERGKHLGSPAASLLANPWVIAGIVAAAVAIPLAMSGGSESDLPPGS